MNRRNFLKLPLAATAMAAAPRIDEYDPSNTKIATMVNVATITDDELLQLKQIGLRWVHAEFGKDGSGTAIKGAVERLGRYGLKIHSAMCDTYRSVRLQLGQPGRDEDMENFQTFLCDLGRVGVYSAKIAFHPGNTYTTAMIDSPSGYRAR